MLLGDDAAATNDRMFVRSNFHQCLSCPRSFFFFFLLRMYFCFAVPRAMCALYQHLNFVGIAWWITVERSLNCGVLRLW